MKLPQMGDGHGEANEIVYKTSNYTNLLASETNQS